MATIEELINQYRSDLPDYLRKMAVAPDRAPAAGPAVPEEVKTVVERTEPQVDPAIARLMALKKEAEARLPESSQKATAAQEAYRQQIMQRGGPAAPGAPSPFGYSKATLEALDQAEKEALRVAGEPPKKEEVEGGWQQAAITLLPALLGGVAGAASGTPGGAAAGVAAGGQASAETLKAMGEARSEKLKRETEQYVKRLDVAKEVFKRKIETLTAPELQGMKATSYFAMQVSAERAKQAVQRGELQNLGEQQIKNLPEVKEYQRLYDNVKQLETKIAEAAGKVGQKQLRTEKETGPRLEKEKGPRQITPAHAERISAYNSTEEQLVALIDKIKSNEKRMGPVAGRVGALNPYDKEAKSLGTEFGVMTSSIARAAEGGRMSDQDIKRFTAQAPQLTDDPAVAIKKASVFLEKVRRDRKNFVNSLETGNFDVSKYKQAEQQAAPSAQPEASARQKRIEELKKKLGKK